MGKSKEEFVRKSKTITLLVLVACLFAFGVADALAAKKIRVAVTQLKNKKGVEKDYAELMTDVIRTELFESGKFEVMNREDMVAVLGELKFQESGACDSTECAVQMGSALGVEKMVAGSVGKMGKTFVINVKLIDIQAMKNEQLLSEYHKGSEDDLPDTIAKLIKRMAKNVPTSEEEEKQVAKKSSKKRRKTTTKKKVAPRPERRESSSGGGLWSRTDFKIAGLTGTITAITGIVFMSSANSAYEEHEQIYADYNINKTDSATVEGLFIAAQDKYDSYKSKKTLSWLSFGVTGVAWGYCAYLSVFKSGGSARADDDQPAFYAGLSRDYDYETSYQIRF